MLNPQVHVDTSFLNFKYLQLPYKSSYKKINGSTDKAKNICCNTVLKQNVIRFPCVELCAFKT